MKLVDDLSELRRMGTRKKTRLNPQGLVRIYRVFGRHYKKYWKIITASMLSLFVTIGVTVLQPWPLKIIIDYILLKEPLPDNLLFLQPYCSTIRSCCC